MVGCGIRFSDKENSSKEFEIFSLCGISLRNNKICLCDDCSHNLKKENNHQQDNREDTGTSRNARPIKPSQKGTPADASFHGNSSKENNNG